MNTLFQGFLNALKARITPIWTRIRLLTNPTYVKGELLRRLIRYFRQMTDVKPRDKNDYYTIFNWLVSKRLAFLIVITVGMVSAMYLTFVQPLSIFTASGTGVKTYAYNSIPLRFAEGNVKILAKSDYVAYEGTVADGMVKGVGSLFRKDGSLVYKGDFDNNEFHGTGTSYFPSGQIQYSGTFAHNLYNGNGILYRENGSKEYEGAFLDGKKEGAGTLYDSGNNPIFKGNFSADELLYADFIGKNTAEANQMYVGEKTVYTDEEYFVVDMADIDAICYGYQNEENLENTIVIEGVYVLRENFPYADDLLQNVSEVRQIMGEPIYEGNAYVIMPEAVAIHSVNQRSKSFFEKIDGKWNSYLADAVLVESFDSSYTVYIYTYSHEGMLYTFFCNDRSGTFGMYLVEKDVE